MRRVYDFVQNLEHSESDNTEIPVQEQTIEIHSTPRKVIFAHPPSEIIYSVSIEPGSSLAFAIGIMPGAWDKIPQGVKFDIEVLSDGIDRKYLFPGAPTEAEYRGSGLA